MLRRIVKTIVVLAVLAAVIAVGGSLILRSDWLGEQILTKVSSRLGMDVSAESFSLGWGGNVVLGQMHVRMPLGDSVVFSADRMKLGLGAVPLLVLGRPIHVRSMELDHPTVFLRQGEDGRWNVQDVWTRVVAAFETSQKRSRQGRLPEVIVRNGMLQITDSGGTTQTLRPIGFDGHRQGQVLWSFDLQAPPVVHASGRVIEGSDWAHEVRFHVKEIGPMVCSVLREDLSAIRLEGQWKGTLAHGVLRGAIQLDECVVARAALQGSAQVVAMSDGVTIHPQNLIAGEPNLPGETIQLTDGVVRISRARIALESLAVKAHALGATIDGRWDWEARSGELSGSWAAAELRPSSGYDGTCWFSVASPRQGRKEVQAKIMVQAQTPLGSWHAVAEAQAGGKGWRMSRWQVKVPVFSWARGERQVDVADVAARIELHWPEVRLTSLSIPAAQQVDGQARFDADTRRWSAQVAVERWHGPSLGASGLDLRLSAEGDDKEARISELHAALGESVLTVRGGLSLVTWNLRKVHLSAHGPARVLRLGGTSPPPGRWQLEANVTGQVQPVSLDAEATLTGQDIALGKRRVDCVQIPVHVRADTDRVEAITQPFDVLGGHWQSTGRYEFCGRVTRVHVLAADLSLAAVAGMAGWPLTSQGQAHAAVTLHMPGLEIQKAVATGDWSARDVNLPPLVAHHAQGALRISGGLVQLKNIQLEQEGGHIDANASLQLDEPQVVSIELSTHRWPLSLDGPSLTVVVDGRTKLRANVVKKTADGDAQLAGRVVWHDKDLADIRLAALVRGQTVDVHELHAQILGGTAAGTAVIPLNRWSDSVAQLRWQGIQPKQLQAWLPSLTRFQGTMSGALVIEQTREDAGSGSGTRDQGPATSVTDRRISSPTRPLGPMRFVLDTDIAGGRFGPAQFDVCRMTGYLDPKRLLVENARFDVLGGRVVAQARFSRHAGTYYGSVVADFNELSLDQLVHAIDPNAAEHPGRLAGSAMVLPVFERGILLSGGGRVRLTESDLANNTIVRSLYNTLSLHFGSQEPTGTGEVELQLQGPAVVLSSAQYFNRGVEIRGAGRIANVNLGANSPVAGYAVASTRVLKGVKLPGIRSLDRLLDVLQTSAGSVKIAGVVDNVQVQVVPLPEVLGPFRRLLWAQLRE
jgi:hypothetical protein